MILIMKYLKFPNLTALKNNSGVSTLESVNLHKSSIVQSRKLAASRDIQCADCYGKGGKNTKSCQVTACINKY